MSAYYGVATGGSGMVICHKVTVQTYTKTLPNGKTVTVQGYTRAGDAAEDRKRTMRDISTRANISASRRQIRSGSDLARFGASMVRSNKFGSVQQRSGASVAAKGVGSMARGAAGVVGGYAKLASNKAADMWSDAKEVMSVGVGNFMEQAKYAGSVVGAYCEMGMNWLKNLISNVSSAIGDFLGGNKQKKAATNTDAENYANKTVNRQKVSPRQDYTSAGGGTRPRYKTRQ